MIKLQLSNSHYLSLVVIDKVLSNFKIFCNMFLFFLKYICFFVIYCLDYKFYLIKNVQMHCLVPLQIIKYKSRTGKPMIFLDSVAWTWSKSLASCWKYFSRSDPLGFQIHLTKEDCLCLGAHVPEIVHI